MTKRRRIDMASTLNGLPKIVNKFNTINFSGRTGDQENLELVKKVSPVAWVNVNLNGTYSFTFEKNMINMAEVLSPLTGKMGKIEK